MANITIRDEAHKEKHGKYLTYYMDDKLKSKLDEKIIPALLKKDEDRLILVDGNEGAGKSTLAMQIGKHIDPSLDLSRICFNAMEFRSAILKAKKGQVIIYDEAFTGLSSRSSLSGVNKVLVSLMMQMRQKNLCVIVVLPTFFLLDKYASVFRSVILIHVYKSGGNRGYFKIYSRKLKKLLYLFGAKTYSYSPKIGKKRLYTKFKGRFYGVFALGDEEVEKKYRDMKMKALEATEKDPMSSSSVKFREQRDILLYLLAKDLKLSSRKLSNYLADYDFDLSYRQILSILSKYGLKEAEEEEKDPKSDEKHKKRGKKGALEPENDENDDFDQKDEENDTFDL